MHEWPRLANKLLYHICYKFKHKLSVTDHEPVKALCVLVLVANHAVATILDGLDLNHQQLLQIFEHIHLLDEVFRVVLDVLLMGLEVLDNRFLLLQFRLEEVLIRLELGRKPLVSLGHELSLVVDALKEGVMDLVLDVLEVVLPLILTVRIERALDVFFQALLLRVQLLNHIIVLLLPLSVLGLQLLRLTAHVAELDDLGSQYRLAISDFLPNLLDRLSDLLQSLVLCAV